MKYSICMITLNDIECIEKTLQNLCPFINDEFIIIDGGSSDGTLELIEKYANNYNIMLFSESWNDDFSYQKNLAIEKAKNKWILWVDADETYEYVFLCQLPWYIWDAERNGVDCIYVPRINTIEGLPDEELQKYTQEQGWQMSGFRWINYPDTQQQIFKSNCKFVGRSHERIVGASRESSLVGQHILHPKTKDRQQRGLDREKHLYEHEAQNVLDRIMEGEEKYG